MIRRSSRGDAVTAYSLSSSIRRCGLVLRFRPSTCHGPVSPGSTENRSDAESGSASASSGHSGRGPTKLISPRSTFNSCGNSSMLQRRSHRPTRVMRGSLVILKNGDASFRCATERRRLSASARIVRSFQMTNGVRPRPTRVCRKMAGAGDSRRIAIMAVMTIGIATGASSMETSMSIARLTMSVVYLRPTEAITMLNLIRIDKRFARMETGLVKITDDHERRMRSLERRRWVNNRLPRWER